MTAVRGLAVADQPRDVHSAVGSISDKRADLRVLIPAVVAWGIGVWAHTWAPWVRLLVAVIALALVTRLLRRPLAALTLAVVALVLITSAQQAWRQSAGPVEGLAGDGAVATVTGHVLAEPIPVAGHGMPERVLVRFRLTEVDARGYRSQVSTPVLIRGDEQWRRVQWRQEITVSARFREARPGSPERALLIPLGPPQIAERDSVVLAASDHARERLRTAVDPLPRDARALVPALVVGDTSLTPSDLSDAMKTTGMTHLSAVSGSNLAICLTAVMAIVVLTPVRRRWRVPIGLAVIVVFLVMARPEPSVMRAALMGAVGVIAFSRGRAAAGLPALSATMIVLLAFDPWLARSYGFVLSTLATLGLILFARPWGRAIMRAFPRRIRGRLPPAVGDALAIPVAAHVMTAPVVVLLQGHVSLVAVVCNLLAAPLVAPATLAGALATLLASFSVTLGSGTAWLSAPPAWLTAQIGRQGAQVPHATIPWPEGAVGALLLAGIFLALLLHGPWLVWAARTRPGWATAILAVLLVASWPVRPLMWPPQDWRVVVCDVGQGDGIVIATGSGRAVVVDTGPDAQSVPQCLRRLGVTDIDALVITHFDLDHTAGVDAVTGSWPVHEIFVPPVGRDDPSALPVLRAAAERRIPMHELRGGDRLSWGAVHATVWWPLRTIHSGSVTNNSSIVLAVESGSGVDAVRALLLGDIERESGRAILTALRREPLWQAFAADVHLVKTPHHGSGNLDETLLRRTAGTLAVVSVGDNDFGHPTENHLELYALAGSVVLRTDQHGDIALLAPGEAGESRWRAEWPRSPTRL